MSLELGHLLALAVWVGVLMTEGVLELLPLRRPELRPATSTFHYYVDLLVELPVLLAIVATGTLLVLRRPIDARLLLKVAGGSLAVLANLVCIGLVVARHRGATEALEGRTRLIYRTVAVGSPGFVTALYLGAGYAGWLG